MANVIREAKTYMLPGIIQTGKKQGMQLMDDALMTFKERPQGMQTLMDDALMKRFFTKA